MNNLFKILCFTFPLIASIVTFNQDVKFKGFRQWPEVSNSGKALLTLTLLTMIAAIGDYYTSRKKPELAFLDCPAWLSYGDNMDYLDIPVYNDGDMIARDMKGKVQIILNYKDGSKQEYIPPKEMQLLNTKGQTTAYIKLDIEKKLLYDVHKRDLEIVLYAEVNYFDGDENKKTFGMYSWTKHDGRFFRFLTNKEPDKYHYFLNLINSGAPPHN